MNCSRCHFEPVSTLYVSNTRIMSKLLTKCLTITGTGIQTTWNKATKVARAAWDNVFILDHPLYFEVTVQMPGQTEGDLLQWQETTNTFIEIEIDLDQMTSTVGTVLFSIRAISYCGLYSTEHGEQTIIL